MNLFFGKEIRGSAAQKAGGRPAFPEKDGERGVVRAHE